MFEVTTLQDWLKAAEPFIAQCVDETQGDESPALIATLKAFAANAERELAAVRADNAHLASELDNALAAYEDERCANANQAEEWYGDEWERADMAMANNRTNSAASMHVHE